MRRLPDDKFRGRKLVNNVTTYRLFLGIYPPISYISYFRNVLQVFDKQKRNLRSIPVDQTHLTLRFIGGFVTESSKDLIIEELQKHVGNFPKPTINIDKIQFGFKYQNDPRVLMASIQDNKDLIDLSDIVHEKIRSLRLDDTIRWKEKGHKTFHITISRLKENATRSSGKEILNLIGNVKVPKPEPFTTENLDFVVSKLTSQGPVYKKLSQIIL